MRDGGRWKGNEAFPHRNQISGNYANRTIKQEEKDELCLPSNDKEICFIDFFVLLSCCFSGDLGEGGEEEHRKPAHGTSITQFICSYRLDTEQAKFSFQLRRCLRGRKALVEGRTDKACDNLWALVLMKLVTFLSIARDGKAGRD